MKYTTHEICADIASTMDRVRELGVSPERASALSCLETAKWHLERTALFALSEDQHLNESMRPIQTSPFPQVALASQWPPGAADNQRVRNTATQAFRSARKILEGILK